jgi:hypothetical protein
MDMEHAINHQADATVLAPDWCDQCNDRAGNCARPKGASQLRAGETFYVVHWWRSFFRDLRTDLGPWWW